MPLAEACSWNTIISGLAKSGHPRHAAAMFLRMCRSSSRPDSFTYASILPYCSPETGRQLHAQMFKSSSDSDAVAGSNLMRMYAQTGVVTEVLRVFEEMSEKDAMAWNVLLSNCSELGMGELCLQFFQRMVGDGVEVDEFTFAIVLNELAVGLRINEGLQVHSMLVRSGICSDRYTCNALLNLYSKCGFIGSAAILFDEIHECDVVSWTLMIAGLAECGMQEEAFEALSRMRVVGEKPNSFTFGSLIGSCARASLFGMGKQCHAFVAKTGLDLDVVVGSALVNMYSKCGGLEDALVLFSNLRNRDIASWNALICGLAWNGESLKALILFDEMMSSSSNSVSPNAVTFVGVLTACSHGGLVREGCRLFNEMINKFSIQPQPEHYACLVDILARVGLLEDAEAVILSLPFEPDEIIWGALLAASKRCGRLDMAKQIVERLAVVQPSDPSRCVLLANAHVSEGQWNVAMDVREAMCKDGSKKATGISWIEIEGRVNYFTSGCSHHPEVKFVCEVLQSMWSIMQFEGWL